MPTCKKLKNYFPLGATMGALSIFIASFSWASTQETLCQPTFQRTAYKVWYDARNKIPYLIHERLTQASLANNVSRDGLDYKEDTAIHPFHRSKKSDFADSHLRVEEQLDVGHMAPAGNHNYSQNALVETFLLSNMCPQNAVLNREGGVWNQLEDEVRSLVERSSVVHVYTGPAFVPVQDDSGNKYITYWVIGDSEVGVPTHFFKVIFAKLQNGRKYIDAYLIPNEPLKSADHPTAEFKVSVERIEKLAGVIFSRDID